MTGRGQPDNAQQSVAWSSEGLQRGPAPLSGRLCAQFTVSGSFATKTEKSMHKHKTLMSFSNQLKLPPKWNNNCSYSVLSHFWVFRWWTFDTIFSHAKRGWSTTLIQMEISQQLLHGLTWNSVEILLIAREWILTTLTIPWLTCNIHIFMEECSQPHSC